MTDEQIDPWYELEGVIDDMRAGKTIPEISIATLRRVQAILAERGSAAPDSEPAVWIAEDAKRHGMHPAYFSEQARDKYGSEGVWIGFYSGEQLRAARGGTMLEDLGRDYCIDLTKPPKE
jgi:hypothetical protein